MATIIKTNVVGVIKGKSDKGEWGRYMLTGVDKLKSSDKCAGSGVAVYTVWDSQSTKKVGDVADIVYAGKDSKGNEKYIFVG